MASIMAGGKFKFKKWEERIICAEKEKKEVHYYLNGTSGLSVLVIVGKETSRRHMTYGVTEEFSETFGLQGSSSSAKPLLWRSKRETVEWLEKVVPKHGKPSVHLDYSRIHESKLALKSLELPGARCSGSYSRTLAPYIAQHRKELKGKTLNEPEGTNKASQVSSPDPQAPRQLDPELQEIKASSTKEAIPKCLNGSWKRRLELPSSQIASASSPSIKVRILPKLQPCFPSKIGQKIEVLSLDSGIRGCWHSGEILEIDDKKWLEIVYDVLQDPEFKDTRLKEWIPPPRVAPLDELQTRLSGRLRVRPAPPVFLMNHPWVVGASIDAWLWDAWWEGVVTKIMDHPQRGSRLKIYFPGEKFQRTVKTRDVRPSKDWVNGRWIDANPVPNILDHISRAFEHYTK